MLKKKLKTEMGESSIKRLQIFCKKYDFHFWRKSCMFLGYKASTMCRAIFIIFYLLFAIIYKGEKNFAVMTFSY